MCGIIAITGKSSKNIDDTAISSMLSTLSKRGPDDSGFDRFENTVIGQTRLSIVDLLRGHQPMKDNEEPNSIVFNGEIYGYKELKESLEKSGHKFSTNSDTEVILKSYSEYGEKCVEYLDGMFVFAIWDGKKKQLFVARDRFGKKPFYYTFIDNTFYGASEIKAIFNTGKIKGEIDKEALSDYLRLGYITPEKTIYKNIHTLLPAHAGVVSDGKFVSWKYWDLEKKELDINYDEAKKEIKRLFDSAVSKRMVADVEIGSLLSGGVDSTIVTQYAQKYAKQPIKTFSVGYEGHINELPYAKVASKKIGTDHYTMEAKSNLVDELVKVIDYMDEPHSDSSDFPQHMISELASKKVKVALSGDGADELFMGYGWYQKHLHTPKWKLGRIFGNAFSTQQKVITIFSDKERNKILIDKVLSNKTFENGVTENIKNPIEKINSFDLKVYLPGQLLTKIDRTSMMHSLEVRSPFLDTALAEFVYNLPTEFKISKTKNKIILKDILSETFPKDFVYRKKQGFGAPIEMWLKDQKMKDFVQKLLNTDNGMYKFLNKGAVIKVFDNFYLGKKGTANKLWNLVCLAIWFNKHEKNHA